MEKILHKIGREELEILFQMTSSLSTTLELGKILEIIIDSAKSLLKAEASSLLLLDETTSELYFASATGEVSERLKNLTVPLDKGIAGACVRTGKIMIVDDTTQHEEFYPKIDEKTGFETRSIIATPLISGSKTIGVIEVLNKKQDQNWTEEDQELLIMVALQAAQVIQNARMHLEIHEQHRLLRDEVEARYQIIFSSKEFNQVMEMAKKVAASNTTVLLRGENGTGKELIARHIHRLSARKDGPFIAVNCAAIPTTLLESELFGHEKGAFTGATAIHRGRFEVANKGTIFLDEIGDLSPEMQIKILRVLQEKEFERLGGTKMIKVDVRIIAATNQDLESKMKEKTFREDLFYRLNVFPIMIPPLRDRRDDIPLLASHFLEHYAREMKQSVKKLSDSAMQKLSEYAWPGNVRELQNVIQRAIVLTGRDTIEDEALLMTGVHHSEPASGTSSLKDAVDEFKKKYITQVLAQCDNNQRQASKILKIQPTYLSRLLHEYRRKDSTC